MKAPRLITALLIIVATAISFRAGARLWMGEADFWASGWQPYRLMAENFAAGNGMCVGPGVGCAVRPPFYPFLIFLCQRVSDSGYPLLVFVQACIGAATVLCAFLIGRKLFDQRAGVLAAAITAVYPHYVWHDTVLQETSLFTFLTALSVFLLLNAHERQVGWAVAAGICLGLSVLARVTMLPFALTAVIWIALRSASHRLVRASAVAIPMLLMIGAWIVRNDRVYGAPVLNSEIGRFLWNGNNLYTFSHYPTGHIDESEKVAGKHLSEQEVRFLNQSSARTRDSWFLQRGLEFIRTNPFWVVQASFRKLRAAFSLRFSPAKGILEQTVYALSYGPVLSLGIVGMIGFRRRWRDHMLIYLAVMTFAMHTAVFWAHTTHRVYLDVYLIIFAAAAIVRSAVAWNSR